MIVGSNDDGQKFNSFINWWASGLIIHLIVFHIFFALAVKGVLILIVHRLNGLPILK